jgi:predicted O-methyltransferase YrrM
MSVLQDITPVPISQYDDEFFTLLGLYKHRAPKTILEIGTHHGGSLYHWIKNAPDRAVVLSIDDQHINKSFYSLWAGTKIYSGWFKGDSTSYSAIDFAFRSYSPYDWIFIDGDHSYEGVKADWENYSKMISRDGVVVFHDITPHPHREVDKLWEEIKKEYDTLEIIGSTPYPDSCGIGVVFFD